jgi:hypothetical protein
MAPPIFISTVALSRYAPLRPMWDDVICRQEREQEEAHRSPELVMYRPICSNSYNATFQ